MLTDLPLHYTADIPTEIFHCIPTPTNNEIWDSYSDCQDLRQSPSMLSGDSPWSRRQSFLQQYPFAHSHHSDDSEDSPKKREGSQSPQSRRRTHRVSSSFSRSTLPHAFKSDEHGRRNSVISTAVPESSVDRRSNSGQLMNGNDAGSSDLEEKESGGGGGCCEGTTSAPASSPLVSLASTPTDCRRLSRTQQQQQHLGDSGGYPLYRMMSSPFRPSCTAAGSPSQLGSTCCSVVHESPLLLRKSICVCLCVSADA